MKYFNSFIFILVLLFPFSIKGQSTWERTFSKQNHDFRDYSITVAKDGSSDLVLAGTLFNQITNEYLIHVIRIEDETANILFEKTFNLGSNSWAMSICSFSISTGTGYGITGFTELSGVRQTIIMTVDEMGRIINNQLIQQGTSNGIGLNIQATPTASNEGFVIVGIVHDPINNGLIFTQKQSFCLKINQSLAVEWEQYFDSPLDPTYDRDYEGASFVVPTDQGYFITGGKNILNIIGQQQQGILALMLDKNGNELWDQSYIDGNVFDNGASAYYNKSTQEIYVLFNNSAAHDLGITVFDAIGGTLINAKSIQSFSPSLNKGGHTLIKTPFTDKLLIYGRELDNTKGQPAFLLGYDINTQQFGIHYSEPTVSKTLSTLPVSGDPFITGSVNFVYHSQSLVNIDGGASAYLSYIGEKNNPASLTVRKFKHLSFDRYDFCEKNDTIFLDGVGNVSPYFGLGLSFTTLSSNLNTQTITENIEQTTDNNFCFVPEVIVSNSELIIESSYKFFPNPIKDNLTIQFKKTSKQPFEYHLFDVAGRTIKSGIIPRGVNIHHIDLNLIPQHGLYIFELKGENNGYHISKLISHK